MGDIAIRASDQDDLPRILEVLRRALGETPVLKRTPELWNWKHRDNPFGNSLVMVAESEGRIAGVRAMMRWDLTTPDGHLLRCLRPVDTATDPDFERRGIFRSLTEAVIDTARSQGYDLVFNTPNKASGPGYLKMGWQEVGPIGVMARPLIRRGQQVPEGKPPDPDLFFAGPVGEAGGPVTDRAPLGLRTPRTPEYLAWRFAGHPTARYRVVETEGGSAVLRPNLRSGRKELVVSDLFGARPATAVRAAARIARAAYLAAWFSPATPERRAAVRGGLIPLPGVRALTLVANPLRELPVDVLQPSQWDISLGDLELL